MSETRKASTAAGWKKAAVHTVVLPSSAVVDIRIPDVSALIKTGEMPQHLLAAAIKIAKSDEADKEPSVEEMEHEIEFKNLVCLATVVAPSITMDDLDSKTGIPTEDKDMIVAFAMRQAEFDAEGNHIAGLDSSEKFRTFRGISSLYSDVEDVQGS